MPTKFSSSRFGDGDPDRRLLGRRGEVAEQFRQALLHCGVALDRHTDVEIL